VGNKIGIQMPNAEPGFILNTVVAIAQWTGQPLRRS